MRTGIIVARFQTSYLHEAHKKLIEYVYTNNDRVIIFLGTTVTRLTIDNPLDYVSRAKMIAEEYNDKNISIASLPDMKDDEEWSKHLDEKIFKLCNKEEEVTLYASRGGFIDWYHGEYKTEFISDIIVEGLSATDIRNAIHSTPIHTKDWREGVIWASYHKFPASYKTVDVAVIDMQDKRILLGRKNNEKKYRFFGGFVDINDESEEYSAKRELFEEVGGIETDEFKYIGSARIDDWRYRNSKDKIMTSFFVCKYLYGLPKSSDDIFEVEWFNLSDLKEDIFEPEHIILYQKLNKFLIR